MFGLVKYIDKIYQIKWYFDKEQDIHEYEDIMYCRFKKRISDDYYTIDQILYTYVDILLGLEDLNFTFEKKDDDYICKITEPK